MVATGSDSASVQSDFRFLLSSKWVARVVWAVWLAMVAAAAACVALYGRNVPLCEDWYFVGPLVGNDNVLHWAWEQNGEHRTPLARVILLGALNLIPDYRIGMVINVVLLALSAALLMKAMSEVRGRPSLADAFFPIAILHLGLWENITWAWQTNFTIAFCLVCMLLVVFLVDPWLRRKVSQLVVMTALLLFPLSGAEGLAFTPMLIVWSAYSAVVMLRNGVSRQATGSAVVKPILLLVACLMSMAVLAFYFVNYEPSGAPPSPGPRMTLKTAVQFVALGFGPVASQHWTAMMLVTFLVVAGAAWLVLSRALTAEYAERHRALALAAFLVNMGLFSLMIGWGRAGMVEEMEGLPPRYVHLSLPTLLVSFAIWEMYGGARLKAAVPLALMMLALVLIPFNTALGFTEWGSWYRTGMAAFERDLAIEPDYRVLAEKHKPFLIPWWSTDALAAKMLLLENGKIGPFAHSAHAVGR